MNSGAAGLSPDAANARQEISASVKYSASYGLFTSSLESGIRNVNKKVATDRRLQKCLRHHSKLSRMLEVQLLKRSRLRKDSETVR